MLDHLFHSLSTSARWHPTEQCCQSLSLSLRPIAAAVRLAADVVPVVVVVIFGMMVMRSSHSGRVPSEGKTSVTEWLPKE